MTMCVCDETVGGGGAASPANRQSTKAEWLGSTRVATLGRVQMSRTQRMLIPWMAVIALLMAWPGECGADEPWVIDQPVTITTPMEVGPVVVTTGGSLNVMGVPEPGFSLRGNLVVIGSGRLRMQDSVVRVLSEYHGQYNLAVLGQGAAFINRCDYQVPSRVQHSLTASGKGTLTITDSDFNFVQLAAIKKGTIKAVRLNGTFEAAVQDQARLSLSDIPRDPGLGDVWVWTRFPTNSSATFAPPMIGQVSSWSFPPNGSSGIQSRCTLKRCWVTLWPLLVSDKCDLVIQDVEPENWIIVGLQLPNSATVRGLANGGYFEDETLDLSDRTLRLVRTTIDTFNVYPESSAKVTVLDSTLGELLAAENSRVTIKRTTVDGTGGWFGAQGAARIQAEECLFQCDVQAMDSSLVNLHACTIEPPAWEPTGDNNRYGAFGNGRLLLDHTTASTTPMVDGSGILAVCAFAEPPTIPPGPGEFVELSGTVAQYSLDGTLVPGKWRLEAVTGGGAQLLGEGEGDVENGPIGTWQDADPERTYKLRFTLMDGRGRKLIGFWKVPSQ